MLLGLVSTHSSSGVEIFTLSYVADPLSCCGGILYLLDVINTSSQAVSFSFPVSFPCISICMSTCTCRILKIEWTNCWETDENVMVRLELIVE